MISRPRNKSYGGLQCPPNHYIVILGSMKGHSEMGQSQKSEGTAIANQLHKCHIMLVKCRNYITPESVAILSHSQNQRLSSVANMFYRISYNIVTMAKMSRQYGIYVFTESLQICHVVKMSRQCCKYVLSNQLLKCHCDPNVTSSVVKMSRCPNTTDPLQWKMTPLQWKMRVTPTDGK